MPLTRLLVATLVLLALGTAVAEFGARVHSLRALQEISPRLAGGIVHVDPASPTGLEAGADRLLTPFADSLLWILLDRESSAEGALRLRHTHLDNAPEGRAVEWGIPYRIWIRGMQWLAKSLGIRSDERSFFVVQVAGPVLFVALGSFLFVFMSRWIGILRALTVLVLAATAYPLLEYFVPGQVDHHGLAAMLVLAMLLGWVAADAGALPFRESSSAAKSLPEPLLVSALAGSLALQVSAATASPVLASMLAAALVDAWMARREAAPEAASVAACIRAWGRLGGALAAVAWLIETLPELRLARLEVVHPSYALAWWAGAELVAWLRLARGWPRSVQGWMVPTIWTVIALMPAAFLVIGGARVFRPSDPFLYAIHASSIAEFRPFHALVAATSGFGAWIWLSPLPVVALAVLALSVRRHQSACERARLLAVAFPLVVTLAMALLQVRWLGLACAVAVATVAVVPMVEATGTMSKRGTCAGVLLGMTTLIFPMASLPRWNEAWRGPATVAPADLPLPILRDIAFALRARLGEERGRVLAGPTTTLRLMASGGVEGIATLYWENLEGLRRAAELFSEPDPERVRERLVAEGITHVVLAPWDTFPRDAHRHLAATGVRQDGPGWLATLPLRDESPSWLRPLVLNPGTWEIAEVHVFEVLGPERAGELALMSRLEAALESAMREAPGAMDAAARLARRLDAGSTRRLEPRALVMLRDLGLLRALPPPPPGRGADWVDVLVGAPLRASVELEVAWFHEEAGRRARAVAAYRRALAAVPGLRGAHEIAVSLEQRGIAP